MNMISHPRIGKLGRLLLSVVLLGGLQVSCAQDFAWAPEFPVGATIPAISAQDQDGKVRTFDDLTGEKGMLLMLSRSFDWCPYCKAQLVQLTEISDQIEAMGVNVVTLTYDSVTTLKTVQEDQGIEFPLLHDENVSHVNAFGVRNLEYEPGHRVYGIPYPGIFLVDAKGVIRAKFAERRYQARPPFEDVLAALAEL
jgi:peroxiredoxin